jgi:hypothetical protein
MNGDLERRSCATTVGRPFDPAQTAPHAPGNLVGRVSSRRQTLKRK